MIRRIGWGISSSCRRNSMITPTCGVSPSVPARTVLARRCGSGAGAIKARLGRHGRLCLAPKTADWSGSATRMLWGTAVSVVEEEVKASSSQVQGNTRYVVPQRHEWYRIGDANGGVKTMLGGPPLEDVARLVWHSYVLTWTSVWVIHGVGTPPDPSRLSLERFRQLCRPTSDSG